MDNGFVRMLLRIQGFLIFFLIITTVASTAQPSINKSSLSLRLEVTNPKEKDNRHKISFQLTNVSGAPLTLVVDRKRCFGHFENFNEYMASLIKIESHPLRKGPAGQFSAMNCEIPETTKLLNSNDSISIEVESEFNPHSNCTFIDLPGYLGSDCFTTSGQYLIKAQLKMMTKEAGVVKVSSNEAPFIVGQETHQPKQNFANILNYNPIFGIVRLDAGKNKNIEVGDIFIYYVGLGFGYEIRINKVFEEQSEGILDLDADRVGDWFKKKYHFFKHGLHLEGDDGPAVYYKKTETR